jgi:hypothetical protein
MYLSAPIFVVFAMTPWTKVTLNTTQPDTMTNRDNRRGDEGREAKGGIINPLINNNTPLLGSEWRKCGGKEEEEGKGKLRTEYEEQTNWPLLSFRIKSRLERWIGEGEGFGWNWWRNHKCVR